MALKEILPGWVSDDSMRDGYLVVELPSGDVDDRWFRSTRDTYDTLAYREAIEAAVDWAWALDAGEYLIPMPIIAGDARREVEMALEFAEPAVSDQCTLPSCWQSTVSYLRGFPLCAIHEELMQDWDHLAG